MPTTLIVIAFGLLAAAVLGGLAWRWRVRRTLPRPLVIDDEAPEMKAARDTARKHIGDFVALFREHPEDALIKWAFTTPRGTREYLDAKVLAIEGDALRVRLVSPPMSAEVEIERDRVVPLSDVADWVVTLPNGKRRGGYTTRVRFDLAKEEWGGLPDELIDEEKKFTDAP